MRMRGGRQAVTFANPWRPIGIVVGTITLGLLLGILLGLQTCSPAGALGAEKEESYLVLASTLYSQGESLTAMKVYLNPIASRDPANMILQLADKYDKSGDRLKQQQAKDLRQLGEALQLGRQPEAIATPSARAFINVSITASPVVTATGSPATAPGSSVTEGSPKTTPAAATPTSPLPPTAVRQANVPPTSTPAANLPPPTPVPTPTASGPQPSLSGQAVARPTGNTGAVMRDQPSTKGVMVGSLSSGTKVEIIRVVEGEAVDPAENRWYLIKFENKTGYVYFKLLAAE